MAALLTSTLGTSLVNAGRSHENIRYNRENTLAANTGAILVLDLTVLEHRSFV
jgi:hypothetical protein